MTINRRVFLANAGSAAAVTGGLFAMGEPSAVEAQSSGVSPTMCNAATATHALAAADFVYTNPAAADWKKIQTSVAGLHQAWTATGCDAILAPAFATITPSMISLENIPVAPILTAMQQYQPTVQTSDVENLLAYIDSAAPTDLQTMIATIQQQGMAFYLSSAIGLAGSIVNQLEQNPNLGSYHSLSSRPQGSNGLFATNMIGMGSTNHCGVSGTSLFFVGLALGTLTVMTMGTAPILIGAAWAGIALYGGLAAGAWGAGQYIACGA